MLLMFVAGLVLIALSVGAFSIGSFNILNIENDFVNYPPFFYESMIPTWLLTIFLFIAITIPFLVLFVLGLRIVFNRIRKFNKTTNLTLLGIWIIAILGLSFSGLEFVSTKARGAGFTVKNEITNLQKDTISLKFTSDSHFFDSPVRRRYNAKEVMINDTLKKYSNWIFMSLKHTKNDEISITITKASEGRNIRKAKENAKQIDYSYKIEDQNIIFNNYFTSPLKNRFKNEQVTITLFIPEGKTLYIDKDASIFFSNIEKVAKNVPDFEMENHYFKMTPKGLLCTDCKTDTTKDTTNVK